MKKQFSSIKAVVFDLMYTLCHPAMPMTHPAVVAAHMGLPVARVEQVMDRLSKDFEIGLDPLDRNRLLAKELGYNADDQELLKLYELERQACSEVFELYPGTEAMLKSLRVAGLKTGICSNANPIGVGIAARLGLTGKEALVDAAAFSTDIGTLKPNVLMYVATAGRLGVSPHECLYVGDGGDNEMTGAKAAGMTTVLVEHEDGCAMRNPKSQIETDYTIRSVADLPELLLTRP